MITGAFLRFEAVALERVDQLALERKAVLDVERRVLGLRVDADGRPRLRPSLRDQLEDLVERRDLELAVELGRALVAASGWIARSVRISFSVKSVAK